MKRKEKEIIDLYEGYDDNLRSLKITTSPFVVSDRKENHRGSYAAEEDVTATAPFGNTTMECEVRQGIPYNYSILYKTDALSSRILVRLDTGDGTHHNRVPDIPLEISQVPTPHIHKYRRDGFSIAYPIPGVDYASEASTKFDYQQGFDYFCNELSIFASDHSCPQFQYKPEGVLVFPVDDWDPNEDANFDNTI